MSREAAVLVTLVAYKVLLVLIGILAQRKTKDGADYYLAGRRMGPVVASLSASASSSSAWTLLGVSGMAYGVGLSALWLFPACVGGFCLNWYVLAPALHRLSHTSGALTATEVLAGESGRPLRGAISRLASLIILGSLLTYVASQFQGAGKSFSETFGIADTPAILIGSAVVVFYTLLGGFWAASLTDTVQGMVMAITAVILPVVAFLHVDDFAGGLRAVPVAGYLSLTAAMPLAAGVGFVVGLLGIGLGYPGQPHVVNRFMALRQGPREVRIARRVAIAWAVVVYAGMILLGLCARILFPDVPDREKALMTAANQLVHPILSGVLVAAVLSAVMSTADSQLLVAASTVTYDLNLGGRSHRSLLFRSRVVVLALSAGAVLGALVGEASIFNRVLFAWASMGCAFGPLLLVTALRGPVSPAATLASMLLGFSLSVASYYAQPFGAWAGACERVFPFLIALVVAWAGSERRVPARRDPPFPS